VRDNNIKRTIWLTETSFISRTNIFFCVNTFCNNTELTQPLDADNPSATKDFPPYVQTVYPQPDKSSLQTLHRLCVKIHFSNRSLSDYTASMLRFTEFIFCTNCS